MFYKKQVELGENFFPPSPRQSWCSWPGGEANTWCKRTSCCSTHAASRHCSPPAGRFHLFTVVLALCTGAGGKGGAECLGASEVNRISRHSACL